MFILVSSVLVFHWCSGKHSFVEAMNGGFWLVQVVFGRAFVDKNLVYQLSGW